VTISLQSLLANARRLSGFGFLTALTIAAGMLRELVLAAHFGLSAELDVYVALLTIYVFVGVQFGHILEQLTVGKLAGESDVTMVQEAQSSIFFTFLGLNALVIVGSLLVDTRTVIEAVFPALDSRQVQLGEQLFLLLLIAAAFMNLSGAVRGSLHLENIFWPGFVTGGITSLTVIVAVVLGSNALGVLSIPVGLVAGGIIALAIHISILRTTPSHLRPLFKFRRSILALWPALLFLAINETLFQGAELLQRVYATNLGVGNASALYYALAVIHAFTALLFTPITKLLFPRITRLTKSSPHDAARFIWRAAVILFAVALICSFVLFLASGPLVALIFVRGEFSQEDGRLTASLVSILAFILPFMSVNRVIRYGLYAADDYYRPLLINIVRLLVLFVLATVLLPMYGVNGLAIAIVLGIGSGTFVGIVLLVNNYRRLPKYAS